MTHAGRHFFPGKSGFCEFIVPIDLDVLDVSQDREAQLAIVGDPAKRRKLQVGGRISASK
jgi:hypothetical protein